MKPSNASRAVRLLRRHALPLALALAALGAAAGGAPLAAALRYDRAAILAGEAWRLLTGHFLHLGWRHLLMNLAGLALIWALFGSHLSGRAWLAVVAAGALAVGGGLLLGDPQVEWYVGLSGVLHAMFVAGALAGIRAGYRIEIALLAFLAGKLAWEQLYGALPGSAALAGAAVIVDAHLYGAAAGLLAGLAVAARRRRGQPISRA